MKIKRVFLCGGGGGVIQTSSYDNDINPRYKIDEDTGRINVLDKVKEDGIHNTCGGIDL